jgi:hypothetical protein
MNREVGSSRVTTSNFANLNKKIPHSQLLSRVQIYHEHFSVVIKKGNFFIFVKFALLLVLVNIGVNLHHTYHTYLLHIMQFTKRLHLH